MPAHRGGDGTTISRYMPARQLQQIAGVGAFAFNTLYKLILLKENHPQLLAQAHAQAVHFVAGSTIG